MSQIIISIDIKTKRLNNQLENLNKKIKLIVNNNKNSKEIMKTEFNKYIEDINNLFKDQQKLLIEENKEKQNLLKSEEVNTNSDKIKSFAEVVKQTNKTQELKHQSKHVVLIYPKIEMNSKELKTEVKSKLDLKHVGNIGINKVKVIRNNGLLIECNNKTECEKLTKHH